MLVLQLCVERFDFFHGVFELVELSLRVSTRIDAVEGFFGGSLKVARPVRQATRFRG